MMQVIADCQVLLARGMGEPTYRARLVNEKTIDEGVQAYLRGNLHHHSERLHRH